MRRTPLVIAAAMMLFAAASAQGQALKIGYINSQEVLASSPEASTAQQTFDREMQGFQQEIAALEEELQGLQQRLEQQRLTLSPDARAAREQAIQTKFMEYQQRASELSQRAEERRSQLIQPIMDRITTVIETIREEGQYHLILDLAAGSIIAADPSLDITPQVIQRLGGSPAGGPGQDQ